MEVEKWGKNYYWKVIIIFNKNISTYPNAIVPKIITCYNLNKKIHHELLFILA
jgi:hypothetical protein